MRSSFNEKHLTTTPRKWRTNKGNKMANKQSEASKQGAKYLSENPTATAQKIAVKVGMSVSGVARSKWWKERVKRAQN